MGLTLLVKTGLEPATIASYSSNAVVLDSIELAPIGVCILKKSFQNHNNFLSEELSVAVLSQSWIPFLMV